MKWYCEISESVKVKRRRIRWKDIPKPSGEQYITWVREGIEDEGSAPVFGCDYIIWDIDSTPFETLESALKRTRYLVAGVLYNGHDAPINALRIVFTTGKGFHVYLDAKAAGIEPSRSLHFHLRRFCEKLLPGGRAINSKTGAIKAMANEKEAKEYYKF